uniref:G_PROTEIN_RECEP_F1_2 domain-containing protein n=1 Tax=Heterorhabditis bacteriophora TaxID=37862 RepID=A0A1I7XKP3_HETBA
MIGAIWLISLALACPIVFGVNVRPSDANPRECRFYNAEFSIGSSIISFVIPCFLVLFVYIRIIIALKKREKAAKLRRLKNMTTGASSNGQNNSSEDGEEAGRIVAGPVVNAMMMALPSMTRHMRRFERHRKAIELAGEDEDDLDADAEAVAELRPAAEPPAAVLLRRFLARPSSSRSRLSLASTSVSIACMHPLS